MTTPPRSMKNVWCCLGRRSPDNTKQVFISKIEKTRLRPAPLQCTRPDEHVILDKSDCSENNSARRLSHSATEKRKRVCKQKSKLETPQAAYKTQAILRNASPTQNQIRFGSDGFESVWVPEGPWGHPKVEFVSLQVLGGVLSVSPIGLFRPLAHESSKYKSNLSALCGVCFTGF